MSKGDEFYYKNFAECASFAKKEALLLVECFENLENEDFDTMLERMHTLEHGADIKKHEMTEALAKAFVTPADREDLDLLSNRLDEVCDLMEEVVQKLYVYNIEKAEPPAAEYAKKLVEACELMCRIIDEFSNFKKSKTIHALIIEANDIEEECDKLHLKTVRELTLSSSDILHVLSWRKIYDLLEACSDSCEHVADCVGSIIMKNT